MQVRGVSLDVTLIMHEQAYGDYLTDHSFLSLESVGWRTGYSNLRSVCFFGSSPPPPPPGRQGMKDKFNYDQNVTCKRHGIVVEVSTSFSWVTTFLYMGSSFSTSSKYSGSSVSPSSISAGSSFLSLRFLITRPDTA